MSTPLFLRRLPALALALLLAGCMPPVASHSPTPSTTPTPDQTAMPSPSPTIGALAAPQLEFTGQSLTQVGGQPTTTYQFSVTNWADNLPHADLLFVAAPELEGCPAAGGPAGSRAVLDFHDATTGELIDTFCALGSPAQLERVWFSLPRSQPAPSGVYVTLRDRSSGQLARSLTAPITVAVGPTPTPTGAPPATPTPTIGPGPTAGPSGWIGPERISRRAYGALSMAVDATGVVHAAAEGDGGVYYLTNASGAWAARQVSTSLSSGADMEPSIALREDGSVAIAFTRYSGYSCGEIGDCIPVRSEGIHLVTNRSGVWSEPERITQRRSVQASLRAGGGHLHLLYERLGELRYDTDASGTWATVFRVNAVLSRSLAVGDDGRPHIAWVVTGGPERDDYCGSGPIAYASQSLSGEFVVETVAGTASASRVTVEVDSGRHPTLLYWSENYCYLGPWEDVLDAYRVGRDSAGWGPPEHLLSRRWMSTATLDRRGAVHLTFDVTANLYDDDGADTTDDGLWYFTDRQAGSVPHQLDRSRRAVFHSEGGESATSALAVDALGRPHILATRLNEDGTVTGLWYAVGPGL